MNIYGIGRIIQGGINLKVGNVILRLFSAFLFVLGVYLFIIEYEVLGILTAIVALILFPGGKKASGQSEYFDSDHHDYDTSHSSADSDSGGGGGD